MTSIYRLHSSLSFVVFIRQQKQWKNQHLVRCSVICAKKWNMATKLEKIAPGSGSADDLLSQDLSSQSLEVMAMGRQRRQRSSDFLPLDLVPVMSYQS